MKTKQFLISVFLLMFTVVATAQTSEELLANLNDSTSIQELLPKKMMSTQSLLWGGKGLMRNFSKFKLTPENREHELKLRRKMFNTHQILGFITLGGMIAQGIVGSQLYNGNSNNVALHEGLATGINLTYITTASLALFSPPKAVDNRKGFSSIKLHKALAIVHFGSMIATNILADKAKDPKYKPWHRAAAYTWFASYAASIVAIKLEF